MINIIVTITLIYRVECDLTCTLLCKTFAYVHAYIFPSGHIVRTDINSAKLKLHLVYCLPRKVQLLLLLQDKRS